MSATDMPPQTILIVDDEPANLRMMVEHLEVHGFRVLVSQDGISGLRRARYARPDLILLDAILPDLNGFELCRQLKADASTSAIPVIFMTILTIPEDKVKAFAVGGVDYITKPVQWEEVLARVTTHLRICALTHKLQQANYALEKKMSEHAAEMERMQQLLQSRLQK